MSNKNRNKKKTKDNKVEVVRKFQEVLKDLPMQQYLKVIKFVEREVIERSKEIEKEHDKQFEMISKALDRNITAAMILRTDYTLEEINKIFQLAWELIEEDNKKVINLKKEGDGDWMKAAEKYVEDIQKRSAELIRQGVKQKNAIEILTNEFPKLSKSMVTNSYKKAKEIMLESKKLKEEIEEDPDALELYHAIWGKEEIENKEVEEMKKENIEINKAPEGANLKILSKSLIMDIQGEYGTYHIENNKVQLEETEFNSKEDVEEAYRKHIEYLTKTKNEALAIYDMIENLV